MPLCQLGPGGCRSSDSSARHVAVPKPACPGMPHLAQAAAREERTAMTVPERPWPRPGGLQHPWIEKDIGQEVLI